MFQLPLQKEISMKKILFTILALVIVSMAGTASALVSYDLNYSNDSGLGPTYATVEISQAGTTIFFDVLAGNDYLLRSFYLNTTIANFDVDTIIITATDPDPLDQPYVINYYPSGTQMDGFGRFIIGIEKQGQHDVAGLSFKIINVGSATINDFVVLSTGSAANGFGHFAAEVLDVAGGQGYTFKARDSGAQVPEPSMIWLFGSAIVGLGFFRFKK
jgi:hypothetical protein